MKTASFPLKRFAVYSCVNQICGPVDSTTLTRNSRKLPCIWVYSVCHLSPSIHVLTINAGQSFTKSFPPLHLSTYCKQH